MYQAVAKALHIHAADLSGVAAIAALSAELDEAIREIQVLAGEQFSVTTGVADWKSEVRLEMIDRAWVVARVVRAHAIKIGDLQTSIALDISAYKLKRMRHVMLAEWATRILEKAQPLQSALEAYGLLPGQLDALDAIIAEYRNVLIAPRTARTARKAATEQLVDLFRTTDALLSDQLDAVMELYRGSDAYLVYKSTRKVVGLPRRKKGGGSVSV
jgi:hypothetical protein